MTSSPRRSSAKRRRRRAADHSRFHMRVTPASPISSYPSASIPPASSPVSPSHGSFSRSSLPRDGASSTYICWHHSRGSRRTNRSSRRSPGRQRRSKCSTPCAARGCDAPFVTPSVSEGPSGSGTRHRTALAPRSLATLGMTSFLRRDLLLEELVRQITKRNRHHEVETDGLIGNEVW